jgi:hypothetical protein
MFKLLFLAVLSLTVLTGCSVEASDQPVQPDRPNSTGVAASSDRARAERDATIQISPNSPADTVRAFYQRLREKKFREAIFLTNLRPAIEGLTDQELKEFQVDLESISAQVPADLQINGEIISGDLATVTAKLPGEDEKLELQQIKLRKENETWVILTVDDEAERSIKKEGKNYFYQLRIRTHDDEARKMLDRIAKAELAYSLQNSGSFAEMPMLISSGFLPSDVLSTESTGYRYTVQLSDQGKRYAVRAVPASYGKTGKLTFAVDLDGKGSPRLTSKDNGGKP